MTSQAIDAGLDAKNRRLGFILAGVAFFMVLMAPVFYWTGSLICQKLGLWPNPDNQEVVTEGASKGRTIKVLFNATVAEELRDVVEFEADDASQRVTVGDRSAGRTTYTIRNTGSRAVHIRPIHFVSPASASRAFQMTQCFCYNDMELAPGEERELVVVYGFQADLDRRLPQALVNYNLEPIAESEMREETEMPDAGSFAPEGGSTRERVEDMGSAQP